MSGDEAERDSEVDEAKRAVWRRAAAIAQQVYDEDRASGAPALDVKHRIEEEAGLARGGGALFISGWMEEIHNLAVEKGWWDAKGVSEANAETLSVMIGLMHIELSRQLEAVREGKAWVENPVFDVERLLQRATRMSAEQRDIVSKLALVHSELSEAIEAIEADSEEMYLVNNKPEGGVVEAVDAVIRIFDPWGRRGRIWSA